MKFQAAAPAAVLLLAFIGLDGVLGAPINDAQIFKEGAVFANTRVLTASEPIRHPQRDEHAIGTREVQKYPHHHASRSCVDGACQSHVGGYTGWPVDLDTSRPGVQSGNPAEAEHELQEEKEILGVHEGIENKEDNSESGVLEDGNDDESDSLDYPEDKKDGHENETFQEEVDRAREENRNQDSSNLEDPVFSNEFGDESGN